MYVYRVTVDYDHMIKKLYYLNKNRTKKKGDDCESR